MTEFKQAIVLREDLEMSKGKLIAQACHASLKTYRKASDDRKQEWESGGEKKIALWNGDRDLRDLYEEAKRKDIPAALVTDAGMTELEPGTKTAVGIGPAREEKIDTITGELELIG